MGTTSTTPTTTSTTTVPTTVATTPTVTCQYHVVAPLQGCYPGREIPTPAECAAASQALGLRFSRAYTSPRYARNCWANFANGAYFNYLQGRAPHTDGATREVCCALVT